MFWSTTAIVGVLLLTAREGEVAESSNNKPWSWGQLALIAGGLVFLLWGIGQVLIWEGYRWWHGNSPDFLTNTGLYGDSFGALNALFSGLAFAMVIVALYMQRQEMAQQQEEMEQTADALQLSSYLTSIETLHQKYESQFKDFSASGRVRVTYRMLSLLLEHILLEVRSGEVLSRKNRASSSRSVELLLKYRIPDSDLINSWLDDAKGLERRLEVRVRRCLQNCDDAFISPADCHILAPDFLEAGYQLGRLMDEIDETQTHSTFNENLTELVQLLKQFAQLLDEASKSTEEELKTKDKSHVLTPAKIRKVTEQFRTELSNLESHSNLLVLLPDRLSPS